MNWKLQDFSFKFPVSKVCVLVTINNLHIHTDYQYVSIPLFNDEMAILVLLFKFISCYLDIVEMDSKRTAHEKMLCITECSKNIYKAINL